LATRREVEQFLIKLKFAARNLVIVDWNDSNNYKTLTSLGYTDDDVECEILSLHIENYSEGPKEDDKRYKQPVWVFGKIIQGREIYIKVKVKDLSQEGDKELNVLCLSFHDPKWLINYPYRNK
jgi:hypothetical protein